MAGGTVPDRPFYMYVTPVQIQINVCGMCECNFKLSKNMNVNKRRKRKKKHCNERHKTEPILICTTVLELERRVDEI